MLLEERFCICLHRKRELMDFFQIDKIEYDRGRPPQGIGSKHEEGDKKDPNR